MSSVRERVDSGEGTLWAALSTRTHRRARILARNLRGPLSSDDLAQEALLRLIRARRRGSDVRSPEVWLDRVMRRVAGQARRRERERMLVMRIGIESRDQDREAETAAGPETGVILKDLMDHFRRRLAELPPPCREIAELRYIEGWRRDQVIAWLRIWRPIGREEARRQLKRTLRAIRALGNDAAEPRLVRGAGRKNAWSATPAPPKTAPPR